MKKLVSTILVSAMLLGIMPLYDRTKIDLQPEANAAAQIPADAAEFNGHFYKVYDESLEWSEAKAYCESLGGHLATATTQQENDFISSLACTTGSKIYYWLGATDEESEGTWVWVTGEPWEFEVWQDEQPDNYAGSNGEPEHCLELNKSDGDWNDLQCGGDSYGEHVLSELGFICEWESNSFMPMGSRAIGDVDGNGKVEAADARLALRASVRLENIGKGTDAFTAADVDRNGAIEAADARYILRASVGLENLVTIGRGIDWIIENNAEAWQGYQNKALCKAYDEQVEQLIARCGKGRVSTPAFAGSGVLDGVSVVRLIDLDRDGTPELYCGYAKDETSGYTNSQAVYRFHDGKLETLFDGRMTNSGSDFSPQVRFKEIDGTTYFVAGMTFARFYYNLEEGKFNETLLQDSGGSVNGEEMTTEQYEQAYQKFNSGGTSALIFLDYSVEYYNAVLQETEDVIALLKNGAA